MVYKKLLKKQDFLDGGLLQEVNRLFFHPRGLALIVYTEEDTCGDDKVFSVSIGDCREEPGGIAFTDEYMESESAVDKAQRVKQMEIEQRVVRETEYGWNVQPVGKGKEKE